MQPLENRQGAGSGWRGEDGVHTVLVFQRLHHSTGTIVHIRCALASLNKLSHDFLRVLSRNPLAYYPPRSQIYMGIMECDTLYRDIDVELEALGLTVSSERHLVL